uniref:Uncharacterized protein n=1 Tax=Megaselia scalaris TaxID=36166 RepID=T1GI18_MEGSC
MLSTKKNPKPRAYIGNTTVNSCYQKV